MAQQFGENCFHSPKKMYEAYNFFEIQKHTTPIFKNLKILKLQDIIKLNTLKLICLYYKDQLPLKIKDIFTRNESVNPYNTRGGRKVTFYKAG